LGASGCGFGGDTAHLAGSVSIGGKPVPADAEASLSFTSPDGENTVAVKIVDSKYDSPKTPTGTVTVHFNIQQPVGPAKVSERTGQQYRDMQNMVPPQYAAGTPLEVTGDDQNRNFDL
jgi:hypothetical protein